jgi:catechol 2,3-dioxygenase-like lactoylglutathione lyase family enzyme
MLNSATVTANVPAGDLKRARDFYADKLGLTPSFQMEDVMMVYKTDGGTVFSIYQTEYAGQAGHTIAQWHVADVAAEVRDLKQKGVAFASPDASVHVRLPHQSKPQPVPLAASSLGPDSEPLSSPDSPPSGSGASRPAGRPPSCGRAAAACR